MIITVLEVDAMGRIRRCVRYKETKAPVCVDWEIRGGRRVCVRKEIRTVRRCAEYEPV